MAKIDFWFPIGSTYSYLSVTRLGRVAVETGIESVWRPFNVREIMVAQNTRWPTGRSGRSPLT